MTGVESLKKAEEFLIDFAMDVKKSLADGQLNVSDLANFGDAAMAFFPALSSMSSIPAEIHDLTADEGVELVSVVVEKVAGADEKLAAKVQAAVAWVLASIQLYKALKA